MSAQVSSLLRGVYGAGGTLWMPEWEFDAHPDTHLLHQAEDDGLIRILSDGSTGNSVGLRITNKGRAYIGERPLTLLERLLRVVAVGRTA